MICGGDECIFFDHMINGEIQELNILNVSECSPQIMSQTPTNSHA